MVDRAGKINAINHPSGTPTQDAQVAGSGKHPLCCCNVKLFAICSTALLILYSWVKQLLLLCSVSGTLLKLHTVVFSCVADLTVKCT